MSTTSALFPNSPIKSIQTGYISGTAPSSSTGEDLHYVDVTVSSVTTTKCLCFFDGAMSKTSGSVAGGQYAIATGGQVFAIGMPRMTSATNLRIAFAANGSTTIDFRGRWKIVEFN